MKIKIILGIIIVAIVGFLLITWYTNRKDLAISNIDTEINTNPVVNVKPVIASNSTSDLKTYTNTQYGYSFNYPKDWIIETNASAVSVWTPEEKKLAEDPETKNLGGGFPSNLVVKYCDNACINQIRKDYNIDLNISISDFYKKRYGNGFKEIVVDGKKAYKWTEVSSISTDVIYVDSKLGAYFISAPEQGETGLIDPIVKNIISTFKFTSTTTTPITVTNSTTDLKTYSVDGIEFKYPSNAMAFKEGGDGYPRNIIISYPSASSDAIEGVDYNKAVKIQIYGKNDEWFSQAIERNTPADSIIKSNNYAAHIFISNTGYSDLFKIVNSTFKFTSN